MLNATPSDPGGYCTPEMSRRALACRQASWQRRTAGALATTTALMLAGCGLKGPLYLPPPVAAPAPEASAPTPQAPASPQP